MASKQGVSAEPPKGKIVSATKDQVTVHLVFEGGATYTFATSRVNAERVAGSVSRALTSGSPGQVRFDLGDGGAKSSYMLMDGLRVLAVHVEG